MVSRITDSEIERILSASDDDQAGGGEGARIGKPAADFSLNDSSGAAFKLMDACRSGPLLLFFFPNDFSLECARMLDEYRDAYESFRKLGVEILAVTSQSADKNSQLVKAQSYPFRVLSDSDNRVASLFYGRDSQWLLGQVSRAIFLINSKGMTLYRHVGPAILSPQDAEKLLAILAEMKERKVI